ncbi:MAG: N-acetylmuramoyl-L-alanine amidase [Saprospiraceae bacterium]|jgi:N-acetylmuramoyl-L-alanine amidase|nr:N-acetylmuramoyl-L-alanine amidase [Saprospiraceae bacterium]MBK9567107.1 N-acetylmuramoyl-L-alanine amidase [Saprospiraceae bacterium]MBP6446271.1 N-acetylmuramoyl-L-alanine amidase [Saprospiraceae bacterium]
MLRYFVYITGFLLMLPSALSASNHAVARVKKGENIEKLLKRHLLTPHLCNIDAFRNINKLKNPNKISAGKVYKLPLQIVEYNGKNIRTSAGINDLSIAKKIEKLNTDLLKMGIRDKNYKENGKLWVPYAEYNCEKEKEIVESDRSTINDLIVADKKPESNAIIPTATEMKRTGLKEIYVPLMGKGYNIVHVEDLTLSGQVYYIISGHGGPDPGAVCSDCPSKMCEDEYAYDVALRLARDLMQHGATVHMIVQDKNDGIRDEQYLICDNDEKLMGEDLIPLNQKRRLKDRIDEVNHLYKKYRKKGVKVQKAIEIHVDSRSKGTRQDVFFYYNKNNPGSKKMAENTQDVFSSKYDQHQKDRGYKGFVEDRGIYMVRNLKPDLLFVELANIRNTSDQKRLIINTNRQALANWLFEGIRKSVND